MAKSKLGGSSNCGYNHSMATTHRNKLNRLYTRLLPRDFDEIDQSMSIVVEAAQNSNRTNFPLKSKAKTFDGLTVGFRPSAENFCV